ncbi:DUF6457 domain-containing protein [Cellulomonas sp. C5510]|uniref:DUF6457 domain-containing protein n=1 Tax=Cellulomonas sp. C5510 TaxID=2871170 RepID=UPI001C9809FF|nr:DUF6457 domain-containing protein [Cellulomonas sp. C5510]QZN84882.1 DUF6457 domain-containing protein [Cellulomonas sp. C5510]
MDPMAEMDRWLGVLGSELGLPDEVLAQVKEPLLGLVRDVAHGVARPAGAMSGFLVGLAAGLATPDGDAAKAAQEVLAQIERVDALVARWVPPS